MFDFIVPRKRLATFAAAVSSARIASSDAFSSSVYVRYDCMGVFFAYRSTLTRVFLNVPIRNIRESGEASASIEQFLSAVSVSAGDFIDFKTDNGRLAFLLHGTWVFFDAMYPDSEFYNDPTEYTQPAFRVGRVFLDSLKTGNQYARSSDVQMSYLPDRMIVPTGGNFLCQHGKFPRMVISTRDARRIWDMFGDSERKIEFHSNDHLWYLTNGTFGYSFMRQQDSVPYHANLDATVTGAVAVETAQVKSLLKYLDSPGFSETVTVAVGSDVKLFIGRRSHGDEPCSFSVSVSGVHAGMIPQAVEVPVKRLVDAAFVFKAGMTVACKNSAVMVSDGTIVAVVYGKSIR